MRLSLSFAFVLALFASPLHAASLDMSRATIVATFDEFNLTTNFIAQNGKLLIPDSQKDVLMVRDLAGGASYDVPLTVQRANFITAMEGNKVAISDPSFDKITVVDYSTRRELQSFTYTNHFGPWHLSYFNGVIYGSNMFDQLINRYNTSTRRMLSDYQGGSGPTWLVARQNYVFVLEQGAAGAPGDDHIVTYDPSGNVLRRDEVEGSVNEMTAWGTGVCITISYTNKLQCGHPETNEWVEAPTATAPWGIAMGHDQIWVLARGDDEAGEPPTIITYVTENGVPVRKAAWKLRGIANLDLARSLAYDAQTNTLLVRGSRSVYAIPVVD